MKIRQMRSFKKLLGVLVLSLLLTCIPTVESKADTTTPEQKFRELYLTILENGDSSVHDISDLNLPYMTCYDIMNDVKTNEGFLAYQCYNEYNLISVDSMPVIDNTPYLYKFHMGQTDTDFQERYTKVKNLIAELQSNLDDKMTDLDKLLYFHEYIVANIDYIKTGAASDHLGGPTLVNGYGVCEGYARGLMIFLKAENIPCVEVAGEGHAWLAAQIDGEWYLIDPTWDYSQATRLGSHYFLVRTDDEFYNTLTKLHGAGQVDGGGFDSSSDTISTSTKYTDWYVHDVWGQMYYYDGYWYYVSNNAIRKNNIQGTDETVILEGTNLSITGIDGRYLSISNNGEATQLDLGEKTTTNNPSDSSSTVDPDSSNNNGDSTNPDSSNNNNNDDDSTNSDSSNNNNNDDSTNSDSSNDNSGSTNSDSSNDNGETTTPDNPDNDSTKDSIAETQSIRVRTPILKSVTNPKGKKAKVVLKEKVSGATGYEIKISTNKNFKKSVKTITFTKKNTTVKNLKKNKTYYVKVRAYKIDANGNKVYGSYSNVMKVKIKK